MAQLKSIKKRVKPGRINRYFSAELKQKIVRDLELNLVTKAEVSRAYEVSITAISKWVYKYSILMKKGVRMVVESKSEARKLLLLKERIKALEQLVGQKQITIEYLEKMIELTERDLGIDIKKKDQK